MSWLDIGQVHIHTWKTHTLNTSKYTNQVYKQVHTFPVPNPWAADTNQPFLPSKPRTHMSHVSLHSDWAGTAATKTNESFHIPGTTVSSLVHNLRPLCWSCPWSDCVHIFWNRSKHGIKMCLISVYCVLRFPGPSLHANDLSYSFKIICIHFKTHIDAVGQCHQSMMLKSRIMII